MTNPRFPANSPYQLQQPQWSANAVIYQINTRQYSASGRFSEVTSDLERIKNLGADIIWLMPIHPIGELHRKGELGSPYAVKDYLDVNPEFGSKDDFRALVDRAHELNLRVILDWVPNHSAWDNPLVSSHPDWYARDYKGDFRPSPWWDWSDIIEFDYDNAHLREYMIEAMLYWVREFDIDGYRCDVAGYVPNDFWHQCRTQLDAVKEVFMLAEWENRDLHETAFNMTYAWSWNEVMHDIANGKAPVDRIRKYYSWNERAWPKSAYRMTFVSNHDMNAWDGTQSEQFGECLKAAIVLSVIGEGMPLIYNSQEAGENKRLAFFERDPIDWQEHEIGDFYTTLIGYKKRFTALHNGPYGARMIQVPNSSQDQVLSFIRGDEQARFLVLLNLSDQPASVSAQECLYHGQFADLFSKQQYSFDENSNWQLPPWGYKVYVSC